jgi:hypothetical protein
MLKHSNRGGRNILENSGRLLPPLKFKVEKQVIIK